MTRALICGGRDWAACKQIPDWKLEKLTWQEQKDYVQRRKRAAKQRRFSFEALDELHKFCSIDVVIHGDARGADQVAQRWADRNGIDVVVFPAEWDKHGRAAGPIRNSLMIKDGKPDLVIAFPGGVGTNDMVTKSNAADLQVVLLEEPRD